VRKYFDNFQDPQGDAIEGAAVSVFNPDGTLAVLYATNSLTGAKLSNPVSTDALGYFWFYIPDGRYNIQFSKSGYIQLSLTDVEIADDLAGTVGLDAKVAAAVAAAIAALTIAQGAQGLPGKGLPPGGTAGQIPAKRSNADYDTSWVNQSVASGFRPEVVLTPGVGTVIMDSASSNNFYLTMTGDVLIANPTGYLPGDRIRLIFAQDGVGNHNLTFGNAFKFSGDTAPVFTKSGGTIYRLDLDLITGGQWIITPFIIQYGGTVTQVTGGGILETLYLGYPWEGATPIPAALLDAATLAAYRTAYGSATLGSKRQAGVNNLITQFGTSQTLAIKRDGITEFTVSYNTPMVTVNTGTDIGLTLGSVQSISGMTNGDLTTGNWTAVITSGTHVMTMDVGPAGSGKLLTLSDSTAPGDGLVVSFALIMQRSIDGLV
jgi:hypothetical protein